MTHFSIIFCFVLSRQNPRSRGQGVGSMVNIGAMRSIELTPPVIPTSQNNHNPFNVPTFSEQIFLTAVTKHAYLFSSSQLRHNHSRPKLKMPTHQHPNTVDEQLLH